LGIFVVRVGNTVHCHHCVLKQVDPDLSYAVRATTNLRETELRISCAS